MGRILDMLTERVIAEPALNDRAILIELAQAELVDASRGAGLSGRTHEAG